MPHDFRAKSQSNEQLVKYAKKACKYFGQANARRVDIVACLKSKKIWTTKGEKELQFTVVPDSEMGDDDGKTSVSAEKVHIQIKQSVFERAKFGDGRARFTYAHELAHGVLHENSEMLRVSTGNEKFRWLRPFESGEHQADVFAAAFLINDDFAEKAKSASDISVACGVSIESATIYFLELTKRRDRTRTAKIIQQLTNEYMAEQNNDQNRITYLNETCTVCGNKRVFPVGSKFMCQVCDTVFDRFQDGDG